ncbi:hypothetical protein C4D60_Mb01t06940 [Musa balbisiana]|uniref:DUF632 domain-containing protein n=1 Tax=Musa balbisiana TaxID=52838 RepID=A0A4S8JMV1_MUSBA|nr:hypothetical protein C4D60_Mb01t06940 [Musa balbisiana]
MASLADIGMSAALNILSALIFLIVFAVLRLQPYNDRVYFPKWYLKGIRSSPTHSGNFIKKFVNLDCRTYLRFLNWMPAALRMPEPELIDHAGLDSAVYIRIYLLGLKIFAPIAVLAFGVLVPVNWTGGTLENNKDLTFSDIDKLSISNIQPGSERFWVHLAMAYVFTLWTYCVLYTEYKKIASMRLHFLASANRRPDQFTVLVRNVPPDPDESVSEHVGHFFSVNHHDHYLTHQVVYNANKLAKLVEKRKGLENWFIYYENKYNRNTNIRPTTKEASERERIISDPNAIMPAAFVSFKTRWGAAVCAQTQQSSNPTLWLTDWAPEPRDVYWPNLAIPFVELTIRRIPVTVGMSIPMKATFFITYIMVDGWSGIAAEILRMKPLIIFHLKNAFLVKTEQDREQAMDPGSLEFASSEPRIQLYFLLGFVYYVITPIFLPFLLIFFGLSYVVFRHQDSFLNSFSLFVVWSLGYRITVHGIKIINVYTQEYESAAAFWPDVIRRVIIAMIISQLLLMGLMSTKHGSLTVPILVLPLLTIWFHIYCKSRFEPAFIKFPLQDAMVKDTLERATEPHLNLRAYLQDAYVHPDFHSEDVEHPMIIEEENNTLVPTIRTSRRSTPGESKYNSEVGSDCAQRRQADNGHVPCPIQGILRSSPSPKERKWRKKEKEQSPILSPPPLSVSGAALPWQRSVPILSPAVLLTRGRSLALRCLFQRGRRRSRVMGCAHSRVNNDEAVTRCKERRQWMKAAVVARNAFAAAHSAYAASLKDTGAALSEFGQVAAHDSVHSSSSSSTGAPVIAAPVQPPTETLLPPPPPLPEFSPSPLHPEREESPEEKTLPAAPPSIDLMKVLTDLDDLFLRASESTHEVSKVLEATRMHYHSNFVDSRGHVDHSARVMRVITWHRSFEVTPGADGSKGDFIDDEWETHATVLDKILAWEKRLYDEVKAGRLTKIEYHRKVALLNRQKKGGASGESLQRTKAAVSHLHTKYIVDMQSMDSTVAEIQRLRDKRLYPKLVELIEGMAKMWQAMHMHHYSQLKMMEDIKALDISNASKETSEHHHKRTLQLLDIVREWQSQLHKLVTHQKQYVGALDSWLKVNLIPIDSSLKEKVSSPQRPVHAPIQTLVHAWHEYLEKQLPEELANTALLSFSAVLNTIEAVQQEELKQKERCGEIHKAYLRKKRAFEDWYQKHSQKRMGETETGGEAASQDDPVGERRRAVESLKSKLDEEVEAHKGICKQVREKSSVTLKTHLPELFRAVSDFAELCSKMYTSLKLVTDQNPQTKVA